MSKKETCIMCKRKQDLENLVFDDWSKNYFCKYSYQSGIKSCIEIQEDYIQFLNTRERPT